MPDKPRCDKQGQPAGLTVGLVALAVCLTLFSGNTLIAAESPGATESQVKAVFLFNFAKYVDWPDAAFSNTNAPITIGLIGTDPFGDKLEHVIEGKTVKSRPFVIKHLASDAELSGCQILFISHSEAPRMREIMAKAGPLPILTVGEDETFAQNGGIINFVLKNGNVRLEIDLAAARKAGVTISSRLLAVADVVKGKTN